VSHLVVMDGLPVIEHLERADAAFARAWWHWWFLGQTDKPDIHGDPPQIWVPWTARPLRHRVIDSGHHQAEAAPEQVADALIDFTSTP
jgi:hypothetical protein